MKSINACVVFLCIVFGSQMLFAATTSPKAEPPIDAPFEYLFDGISFDGWEGELDSWRLNPQERSMQNFAKGAIYTKKKYDHFILQLEIQVSEGGNNGVLIRVDEQMRRGTTKQLEVQFADDRNMREDYNGCLFELLSGPKPKTLIGKKSHFGGAWNFLEIIVVEDQITTFVNGMKVVDSKLPSLFSLNTNRQGAIGLLGWSGESAVRFIRIKPISKDYNWQTSSDEKEERGFKRIFNGKNLRGWKGELHRWHVKNGVLASNGRGNLYSEKTYSDFILRFDFRTNKGADNGVFLRRAPVRTLSGYELTGLEIQILDDWSFPDHPPAEYNGAILHAVPPRRHSLKPTGEWNTMEILAQGSRYKIIVNDKIVVDTNVKGIVLPEVPALNNSRGQICFSGFKEIVEYRNIRIKEL